MARKKEIEEKRKEELEVYVSPSWTLKKDGAVVTFNSPAGCYLDNLDDRESLIKVRITAEEL